MLNELLEDYQEYNEDEALEEFIRLLWASKYGLRTYKRYYSFKIQENALGNNKELIEIFEPYQSVELKLAKSFYQEKMNSIDMIRIHINNMYMYLTDKEVYLSSDYYRQLKIPKQRYYDTIKSIKEGKEINIIKLKEELENSKVESSILKEERLKKKIDLSFKEYKEIINNYILRLFNNYKTPEQYEEEHGWELDVAVVGWHEDNYIVKYFCKSLTGYMMDYVKSIQLKYCKRCNENISRATNTEYCQACSLLLKKEWRNKQMDYSEELITESVNKNGSKMKIKEIINKNNVTVQFEDGYIANNVYYRDFIKGSVKNPYDKTICGVGYIGEFEEGKKKNEKFYTVWKSMLNRVYSEKYHDREKNYKYVEMDSLWLNFQNFSNWCENNYYEIEGERMSLDKDVLSKDKKIYSPETCIFLPKKINNMFINSRKKTSNLPLGVKWYKREKRYYVYCSKDSNKSVYGGSYTDIESAHKAYIKLKKSIIDEVANDYKDKIPTKVYEALLNYEVR